MEFYNAGPVLPGDIPVVQVRANEAGVRIPPSCGGDYGGEDIRPPAVEGRLVSACSGGARGV